MEKYTNKKYPSATSIAGVEISLTEMREFIICVATGTAMVEIDTIPNPVQNQVLKLPQMPPTRVARGGKKGERNEHCVNPVNRINIENNTR